MRTVDFHFLISEQRLNHLLRLVNQPKFRLMRKRHKSLTLKSKKSSTKRQQSLLRQNLPIPQLMKANKFLNSHQSMHLPSRSNWTLKRVRKNQRHHLRQTNNLHLIKDTLRSRPSSLLNKSNWQISKLVNKLRVKIQAPIQSHQKKELLQQNQQPKSQLSKNLLLNQ